MLSNIQTKNIVKNTKQVQKYPYTNFHPPYALKQYTKCTMPH